MTDQQVVQQQEEKDPRPLSTLIEDGRKLHPRTRGNFVRKRHDGTFATCVLGAMCEALTGQLPWNLATGNIVALIYDRTGIDLSLTYIHPLTREQKSLCSIMVDLNDTTVPGYSDEDIIFWLREHEL